ncbi:MAG: hypothetical protein GC160_21520 [Acidobacteria bacterium]|nr:hypothetical protein [Acidobacteriota bacterium]
MLRITQGGGGLVPVRRILTEPLGARYDLRRLALENVDAVFGEIGQRIFVLGRDLRMGADDKSARVDILGLDPAGNLLLTFIRPRTEPDDLTNAVRAASAAAPWRPEDFLERLSAARRKELTGFLEAGPDQINRSQRIVLLSEDYDFDALLGVRMLRERRNMDVLAIHAALALDYESGAEYMACSEMSGANLPAVVGIPLPEAARKNAGARALPAGEEGSEEPASPASPSAKAAPKTAVPAAADDKDQERDENRVVPLSTQPLAAKPFKELFIDGWKVVGAELNPDRPTEPE